MNRTTLQFVISGALVAFLLGFFIGRATGPTVATVDPATGRPVENPNARAIEALEQFESQVDVPLADQARVGLAKAMLEMGTPVDELMGHFIDRMSDRELIGIVDSFTNFDKENFEGIRDIRGYVRRLSTIAMQGVLQEASPNSADEATIVFSSKMGPNNRPEATGVRFASDSRRLYATFPTYDYDSRNIIAKWFTTNPPNLILFGQYPISSSNDHSYVWLEKKTGWDPGHYTVEIYSIDGEQRLASNTFDISDNATP